jgi:hypothetical protein
MSASGPLPAVFIRRRNAMLPSGIAGLLFLGCGAFINFSYDELAADDSLSLLAMALLCLAPFIGLPALLMGGRDLEGIQRTVVPALFHRVIKWSRLAGQISTGGNVLLLFVFMIQALETDQITAARVSMEEDLAQLLRAAKQYRSVSDTTHAGGTFVGFVIPDSLTTSETGHYRRRIIHPDTIQFLAVWIEDTTAAIVVRLGPEGTLVGKARYFGTFAAR